MADTKVPSSPPHDCPGGCGREVPHRKLSCPDCWWLLPVELRKAVTHGTNRLTAVGEAARWLRENVAEVQAASTPAPTLRITIADPFGGAPHGGRRG